MLSYSIFTFLVCILYTLDTVRSDYTILSINDTINEKPFIHFWDSTGFCPPEPRNKICEYLLSKDVKTNLLLIGALPNKSIKQIRVHWLLDLITIRSFKKDGTPIFDYKCADSFFDWLHSQNLRPGLELMGNPSSYFNDLLDEKQKKHWEILIRDTILRYVERYGVKYVSKWRFESWNEPDLKGYNILNFTLPSYISYILASSSALTTASLHLNTSFRLGGPAGLFKAPDHHPLCWGFLESCGGVGHCGCPLSYISFHKKGDASAQGVVDKGWEFVEEMHERYPKLKRMKIANTEADILTGWSKSEEWRGDVRYAAMVVKVIIDHYEKFIRDNGIKIEVLSNDNGFLNYHPYYFTQRTLLTRFQMNNTHPSHIQFIKKPIYTTMALLSYMGNRVVDPPPLEADSGVSYLVTTSSQDKVYELSVILSYVNDTKQDADDTREVFQMNNTHPPHIQFIKKPIYTTMALLSYMGNRVVDPTPLEADSGVSYLVTTSSQDKVYELSVILSYVNDTKQDADDTREVYVSIENLPRKKYKYVVYLLSNNGSNPYNVWKEFGEPVFPNASVREEMRLVEGPICFNSSNLSEGEDFFEIIPLTLPTIALIHICSDRGSRPGQVTGLQVFNVTKNEVLLVWKDRKVNTKCIRTYEIEFLRDSKEIGDQLFRRVNYDDVIFLSFQFVAEGINGTVGTYRVRAIDYWGRCGPYSNPVHFRS